MWDSLRARCLDSEWEKLGYQRTAETYYNAVKSVAEVFELEAPRTNGRFWAIPGDCQKGSHLKRLLGQGEGAGDMGWRKDTE